MYKQKLLTQLKFIMNSFVGGKVNSYTPTHRIAQISQEEGGEYKVLIQLIGKSIFFSVKPGEILADDNMIATFAPRDVRALTYLGYLGIHSPKYSILAKQLSENNDRLLFSLHKKGTKKTILKNASEISMDESILKELNQKDAHTIGYTVAMEKFLWENAQKDHLKEERIT